MGIGTMTWALLLLAYPGAGASEVNHIGMADFVLPINLDKNRLADIKKVQLYVSRDDGKTFENCASVDPDEKGFPFHADRDGTYWFVVTVITKANVMEPQPL